RTICGSLAGGGAGLQAETRPTRGAEDFGRWARPDQFDGIAAVRADEVHRSASGGPKRRTRKRDESIISRRGPASSGKSLRERVNGALVPRPSVPPWPALPTGKKRDSVPGAASPLPSSAGHLLVEAVVSSDIQSSHSTTIALLSLRYAPGLFNDK